MLAPRSRDWCIFALGLCLTAGSLSAQIVQNGSFENNYNLWTASGHQVIANNDPAHPPSDGTHGASAFFPSPFEHAAILTLDAVGEWSTSSIGIGRGNRIALQEEMRFPHSLGMLYSAFTYYTGFKVNSGEYKLMGLAPYGSPKYAGVIRDKIVSIKDDGSVSLDLSYFNYCQGLTMTSEKFHELFGGPPRQPESFITEKEMDLAASIQVVCEEVVLRAGEHAWTKFDRSFWEPHLLAEISSAVDR